MSPLALVVPPAILLLGAVLLNFLPRLFRYPSWALRTVAASMVLLALLRFGVVGEAYASLARVPVGNVSLPAIDLMLEPAALAWLRLLLLGALAATLAIPVGALSGVLAMLGLASITFLASSFGTLVLAWPLAEVALLLPPDHEARHGHRYLPLATGGAAALFALYASASSQALVLAGRSLTPLSWALVVAALALRLRLWPLRWPRAGSPLTSLKLLVALLTGFFALSRVAAAAQWERLPEWVAAAFVVCAAAAAGEAWLHRQEDEAVLAGVAGALSSLLVAGAALAPETSPWRAVPAAGAALLLFALSPSLPLPRGAPRWLAGLPALLAGLLLLPLPTLPVGSVLVGVLGLLAATRVLASIAATAALVLGLGALLAAASRRTEQRPTLGVKDGAEALRLALLLAVLLLGLRLGVGAGAREAQRGAALAFSLVASLGAAALALASARRLFPDARTPLPVPTDGRSSGGKVGAAVSATLVTVEAVFRLLEGETSLPWASLIGFAVLIIAAGP